jgi:hypothetical protein
MTAWLQTVPARGNTGPAGVLCARLRAAAPGAAQAAVTAALPATLAALNTQVKTLETRTAARLAAHPDAHLHLAAARGHAARGAAAGRDRGWPAQVPRPGVLGGLINEYERAA